MLGGRVAQVGSNAKEAKSKLRAGVEELLKDRLPPTATSVLVRVALDLGLGGPS